MATTLKMNLTPSRIAFLRTVTEHQDQPILDKLASHGFATAPPPPNDATFKQSVNRIQLANHIADISGENYAVTRAMLADTETNSVKDFSVTYDTATLKKVQAPNTTHLPNVFPPPPSINLPSVGPSPPTNMPSVGPSPPTNLPSVGPSPPINLPSDGASPPTNLPSDGASPPINNDPGVSLQ
jgi:hypothetical protein